MAADLRRRDLLDAGERIILQKGSAATTVDDITRAAGVAKGTFYLYFKSKEDLLEALRTRFSDGCRKRIETLCAKLPGADWTGRLDAWVDGGIRHYLDHIELHNVLFEAGQHNHGSLADSPLLAQLTELIRAGAAASVWRAESPELLSLVLFYALHGIVDHIVSSHRTDYKAVIRLSQRIVRQTMGLAPELAGAHSLTRS